MLAAVDIYRARGWRPVPLPRGKKWPPPKGYTGADAGLPSPDDYGRWERASAWGNLAIVVPEGVIGYDVDVYHGGQLPPDVPATVRSTAREDGSGIYLFKVPPGTKLRGGEGPGVEIIQAHHRYAVAWPSLHPEVGDIYYWLWPDDTIADVPAVDELPDLPEKHLSRLAERQRGKSRTGFDGDVQAWLDQLPGRHMSLDVRRALREAKRDLTRYTEVGSRYETMLRATGRLVHLGAERHRGVGEALDRLIDAYVVAVDGERDRDPQAELDRAIQGAVSKFGGRARRAG
jgi:Bifunctional DNA primase/polymerase, N-terminal